MGGVNLLVQRSIEALSEHYKRISCRVGTILQLKKSFLSTGSVWKQSKMVKTVCHTKLVKPTFTDSDFVLKSISSDKKLAPLLATYNYFNEQHI